MEKLDAAAVTIRLIVDVFRIWSSKDIRGSFELSKLSRVCRYAIELETLGVEWCVVESIYGLIILNRCQPYDKRSDVAKDVELTFELVTI